MHTVLDRTVRIFHNSDFDEGVILHGVIKKYLLPSATEVTFPEKRLGSLKLEYSRPLNEESIFPMYGSSRVSIVLYDGQQWGPSNSRKN